MTGTAPGGGPSAQRGRGSKACHTAQKGLRPRVTGSADQRTMLARLLRTPEIPIRARPRGFKKARGADLGSRAPALIARVCQKRLRGRCLGRFPRRPIRWLEPLPPKWRDTRVYVGYELPARHSPTGDLRPDGRKLLTPATFRQKSQLTLTRRVAPTQSPSPSRSTPRWPRSVAHLGGNRDGGLTAAVTDKLAPHATCTSCPPTPRRSNPFAAQRVVRRVRPVSSPDGPLQVHPRLHTSAVKSPGLRPASSRTSESASLMYTVPGSIPARSTPRKAT